MGNTNTTAAAGQLIITYNGPMGPGKGDNGLDGAPVAEWGATQVWLAAIDGRLIAQVRMGPGEHLTHGECFMRYAGGELLLCPYSVLRQPHVWVADFGRPVGQLELVVGLRSVPFTARVEEEKGEAATIRRLKNELASSQRALAAADDKIRGLQTELAELNVQLAVATRPEHPLLKWVERVELDDPRERSLAVQVSPLETSPSRTQAIVTLELGGKRLVSADGTSLDLAAENALSRLRTRREAEVRELRRQIERLEKEG